jgi:hypothetical protein
VEGVAGGQRSHGVVAREQTEKIMVARKAVRKHVWLINSCGLEGVGLREAHYEDEPCRVPGEGASFDLKFLFEAKPGEKVELYSDEGEWIEYTVVDMQKTTFVVTLYHDKDTTVSQLSSKMRDVLGPRHTDNLVFCADLDVEVQPNGSRPPDASR